MASKRGLNDVTSQVTDTDPESGFVSATETEENGSGLGGPASPKSLKLDLHEVHALRTSARVQRMKEERKESESDLNTEIEPVKPSVSKRAWEQWSSEDKAIFFEALNECGKNFDAIQVFFRQKKNLSNKNKEQIRTFYYRTWHKICKYVDFPEEYQHLKKSSKELYGLINFGELRKRLGSSLDDKTGVKLRELIFKGHTTVKIKGKTHRLRTPTCVALKKLTETIRLDSDFSSSVPAKISLVLTPLTTDDFDKVHRIALANPHLSLTVRPGRSLSSVLDHLKQRWKRIEDNSNLNLSLKHKSNIPKITVLGSTTTLSLSNLKKAAALAAAASTSAASAASELTEVPDDSDSSNKEITNESYELNNSASEWNSESAKNLSIGELFLRSVTSTSSNLELHYSWKLEDSNNSSLHNSSTLSLLSKMAAAELSKKGSHGSTLGSPKAKLEASNIEESNNIGESEFRRPSIPLSKPTIQQHEAFR